MAKRLSPATTIIAVFAVASAAAMAFTRGSQSSSLNELATRALARIEGETKVPGLQADVRVIRDTWGVPHIYANSDTDLFFAQGFVAAQDRLWQMEMWRRTAEGRLAEVLGQAAVARDRQARLLKYRGRFDADELGNYHPDAKRLMTAFVAGVNAFMASHADRLPVEFVLTGIKPEPWTVETLLLRQVTFGDAMGELQLARQVASLGAAAANRRRNPDPWDDLAIPNGLDVASIGEAVLAATRGGGRGTPRPEILPGYRGLFSAPQLDHDARTALVEDHVKEPGSNNWVVSGALSATGKPVVANDPHREVGNPSLRYIFHLNAPGWNVIGASEAPFIGIGLGHNDRIAWGLTIVGTDQHDVYVEEVNPANPNEVRWQNEWEPLRIVREEIAVKGGPAQTIELKFSRHGPIFFENRARNRAYALRSALHEPGTAPYLAGLRLSQVKNCREFLDAAMFWKSPSENLICGDVDGNISWQASALTPNRKGWVGRLPVPGTGAYEWQGFRKDLPRELNPARGFVATANHNIQPKTYSPPLMFKNADTRFERITRLEQMIVAGRKYVIEDHRRMQLDALSLRAIADIPLFKGWMSTTPAVERARVLVAEWDGVYRRDSGAAAVYDSWRTISAPADGDGAASETPSAKPDVEARLVKALARLTTQQGTDPAQWRWGRMHTRAFAHPFVSAFDLPTVERPGGAGTVAADGASYREILDTSNWDNSIATNTPGQSAQPGSPFYNNLLPLWTDDQYFPLAFSQQAVEKHTKHTLVLRKP